MEQTVWQAKQAAQAALCMLTLSAPCMLTLSAPCILTLSAPCMLTFQAPCVLYCSPVPGVFAACGEAVHLLSLECLQLQNYATYSQTSFFFFNPYNIETNRTIHQRQSRETTIFQSAAAKQSMINMPTWTSTVSKYYTLDSQVSFISRPSFWSSSSHIWEKNIFHHEPHNLLITPAIHNHNDECQLNSGTHTHMPKKKISEKHSFKSTPVTSSRDI